MKKDRKMKLVALLCVSVAGLLLAGSTGCGFPSQKTETEKIADKTVVAGKKHFPDLAKKVVALGRDWYTFELEVCGKNRKFLYRARNLNHQDGTETITELND